MLHQADEELVSREQSLPAMRLALDPELAIEAIDQTWPRLGVRALTVASVRYDAGKMCLVAYLLETPDGRLPAYLKVMASPPLPVEASLGAAVLAALPGVLCRFPTDFGLPFFRCGDGEASPMRERLRVITYRPEQRLTARLEHEGRPAVLRAFPEADGGTPFSSAPARMPALQSVRVPKLIEADTARRTLVTEFLTGRSLRDLLCAHSGPGLVRHSGEALAALHRSTIATALPGGAPRALAACRSAVEVSALAPPLGDLAAGLARRLAEMAPPPLNWSVCRVRNLHAGNVILGEGSVGFATAGLDGPGDPAADLGSMLGHFESHFAGKPGGATAARRLSEAFAAGYRGAGGRIDARRVRWHIADTLLGLSPEPFIRRAPDWPRQLRLHLERARDFAAEL